MVLLALSIAPGLAICLYIFLKDIYNTEPKRLLLSSFFLGIFSIIPAYFIETYSIPFFNTLTSSLATLAFCVVAQETYQATPAIVEKVNKPDQHV